MRYSLEPTHRRYVKGYGFFARKFGNKYGKKLMNTAKKNPGINAAKKFGDKYSKNLMDDAKKLILLKQVVKE